MQIIFSKHKNQKKEEFIFLGGNCLKEDSTEKEERK